MARAIVEVGHAENLRQTFTQHLYDSRPAYSVGSEPKAEEALKLILHQILKSSSTHKLHAHMILVMNTWPIPFQFSSLPLSSLYIQVTV